MSEEDVKILKDTRSFRRGTTRFQGEHGIYILFSSEIIDKVARDSEITVKEAKIMLFIFYVSKYIAFSAAIYPDLVSALAKEIGFSYTPYEIKKMLPKLYNLKLINKYGNVYVINRDTQDWIKMFTNQLTYKLHNFNNMSFYSSLKRKRRMKLQDKKILDRRLRIAKKIEAAKKDNFKING